MISRYSATLNNISLESIDADILILDIQYSAPQFNDNTFSVAKRNGARFVDRIYETGEAKIVFEIHSYSTQKRQAICNDIVRWAKNGGNLETSDRPGQFLKCICTEFPIIESAKNWTDALTITFTGYAYPFWQEKASSILTLTGSSGSGNLFVPGNIDNALVKVDVKANASISSVSLTVNGRTMTLSGLSVSTNQIIKIDYDDNAIQSIKVGNTSLLSKRRGVDDLLAKCGEKNAISISASASVSATFDVKGMWI